MKISSTIMAATSSATPFLRPMLAVSKLPPELSRLRELANNLWWCWHNEAKMLFRDIDPQAWTRHHNPLQLLEESDVSRLTCLAKSEDYISLYREVMTDFDAYMSTPPKSLSANVTPEHPIAYFSTEYGLHESVPIYSGGLGVLSGDHLKSASDLAIPLIGIGLFYKQGYFRQVLDTSGRQTAQYPENDIAHLPILKLLETDGEALKVKIDLPGRSLFAQVWKLMVGRTPLYLLDSDITANTQEDRSITANLYVADREKRLLQEMLLGIGGVRLIRALGITPSCFHMNEGHSAFLVIERMLGLMNEGMSFAQAASLVRTNTLFTTHTPVAAGNEAFSSDLMQRYFCDIANRLGLSWQQFLQLGQMEGTREHRFEMTILALRSSLWANGVSRLHGEVSRHMWNRIWKNLPLAETPIDYVTNGIHTPSYVGIQMEELLDHYLGNGWLSAEPDSPVWDKIDEIPDDIYSVARATQKEELLNFLRHSIFDFAKKFGLTDKEAKSMGRLLKPDTLLIGFARRFAPYKRATLLFADPDRLERIISDPKKPVCFVFAGKAHPADEAGNDLIQRVIQLSREPRFLGRIFFIENYDLSISRLLSQGCDVWLNTPRRPYEASGTSGMKLPVNGGINLSISDGWWCEGYNRKNGWTIGPVVKLELPTDDQNDYEDAESLYTLLEDEVIPLYHDTDKNGLHAHWIALSKRSLKSLTAMYSSNRMLRDYVKQAYLPAGDRWARRTANDMAEMRAVTEWRTSLPGRFGSVKLENLAVTGTEDNHMICGSPVTMTLSILLGEMHREEIAVELVIGCVDKNGSFCGKPEVLPLKGHPSSHAPDAMVYTVTYTPTKNGHYNFGVRVLPVHPGLLSPLETGLMLWA
nr:alpha-glucan family phosphorylase [Desulfovibrio sp.]